MGRVGFATEVISEICTDEDGEKTFRSKIKRLKVIRVSKKMMTI